MAFNSNYTGEQIEEGIKKSLEALDLNGASVNVEIVDENTPASGTVTKEEGSNRARFDFKIPVPVIKDTGWKPWTLPDSFAFFEEMGFYRVRNGVLYLRGTIIINGRCDLIPLITFAELGITKENLDIPDFPNRILTSFYYNGIEYEILYNTDALIINAGNVSDIECVIDGIAVLIE